MIQYRGDWKKGKMHGEGELTDSKGSYFHGSFVEDAAHGYGEMTWKSGDSYKGGWEKGRI